MDRLSGIYACFITFVGFLIHIFATGYMHGDRGFYRFFAYLNLFMFMMLTLVLADNLLLMFVGWEGVGLCSYLLIGYYIRPQGGGRRGEEGFRRQPHRRLGRRHRHHARLHADGLDQLLRQVGRRARRGGAAVVSALQTIGAMADRAVRAGARSSRAASPRRPFSSSSARRASRRRYRSSSGCRTRWPGRRRSRRSSTPRRWSRRASTWSSAARPILLARADGDVHRRRHRRGDGDLRRDHRPSRRTTSRRFSPTRPSRSSATCSSRAASGAFVAAIFHVMTHAFFKALLFLGSGSVIHGMHHEQDMRRMGGLKKYMPITFCDDGRRAGSPSAASRSSPASSRRTRFCGRPGAATTLGIPRARARCCGASAS